MAKLLSTLQLLCFLAILVTFPLNLFLNLTPNSGYVSGSQIDYLLVKFYVVDIFIWGLVFSWLAEFFVNSKNKQISKQLPTFYGRKENQLFALLFIILFIRQYFTPFPLVAIWQFVSWIGLFGVGAWMYTHQTLLKNSLIYFTCCFIIFSQSLIGLYQFHYQQALFPYKILGETQIQKNIGIAKADFFIIDQLQILPFSLGQKLLPYGTSAHPNVLAGILVITMLITLYHPKRKAALTIPVLLLGGFTLFLTQSFSSWIALILGLILIAFPKRVKSYKKQLLILAVIIFLIFPLLLLLLNQQFDSPSLYRRVWLNEQAVEIFTKNPVFGTGLQQFTTHIPTTSRSNDIAPFIQPAHHSGILLFTEVGVVGFLLFILIMKITYNFHLSTFNSFPLLPIAYCLLPILSLDHYLLTIRTGQELLVISIVLLTTLFSGEQVADHHDRHGGDL